MPLPGIHLIALDNAKNKLISDPLFSNAGQLLQDNLTFASLGAVGQDMLYTAPDISPATNFVINSLVDFLEILEPLFRFQMDFVEPVEDAIDSGANWLTAGVYGDFKLTIETFLTAAKTFVEKLVVENFDLWETLFPPSPISDGHREVEGSNSWYWGDMVHYRCTGKYVQTLFNKAGNDPRLQAFALGAAAHIATDTVIHPFVNAIVGGPYRNHPHRHHFVENVLDVYAWSRMVKINNMVGTNILDARLEDRFNVTGEPFPESAAALVSEVNLPADLAELIYDSLREVYPNPPQRLIGGYLSIGDINTGYKAFLLLNRLASNKLDPPRPPDIDLNVVRDLLPILKDLVGLTPPPGLALAFQTTGPCFSLSCFKDVLVSIKDFIQWGIEQISRLLKDISMLGIDLFNFFQSLVGLLAKYVLYLVRSILYDCYRAFRKTLVWAGMALPFDLDEVIEFDRTVRMSGRGGAGFGLFGTAADAAYPRRKAMTSILDAFHHVPYPDTAKEGPDVFGYPLPIGTLLEYSIRDAPFSESNVETLLAANSPQETRSLVMGSSMIGLGNAIDFTAFLCKEAIHHNLPRHNWNLDADRGYAWTNWVWANPNSPGTSFIDAFYFNCTGGF